MARGYWLALALVIFIAGIFSTLWAAHYADNFLRRSLVARAQTIAAGVNDDLLKRLSGTTADLYTDDYQDLKKGMINIQKVNSDSHFVYIMGVRDGQLFFYADSEPADSADYSAPGDIYADASEFKIKNILNGLAFTEGPYKDAWGNWVSGYAPVFDHENLDSTGKPKILATVGIDIGAAFWEKEVIFAASLPAVVTLLLLLILFFYYLSRKHQSAYFESIVIEREKLRLQEERLRTLYEITANSGLTLDQQLQAAVDAGAKSLHTKLGVLSKIENGTFTVLHCFDPDKNLHEGDKFKLAETYCDITVKKKAVVAIDNMQSSPYQAHVCYTKFQLESYIGVPVLVNEKLFGTLAFLAPEPHRPGFTDSDQDFVRLMGKWVSTTLERELIHQKEIEIDQAKSEFVSVASHQLRTPLTGIKWVSELMLKGRGGELNKEQKEFVGQIVESNTRMINLVNDLLNVSRIETGKKFSIEKKSNDIIPIVDSLFFELIGFAALHKVKMRKDDSLPKELILNIDAEKIRQVLQNLLSNAVKYSKEGGVVIILCDLGKKGRVTFCVKDSGLGIPAAQQGRMFEKFFRADNVQTHETEGTGLGLYIAKAIVEGHGGKIWFESVENKGTNFYFSLPTV